MKTNPAIAGFDTSPNTPANMALAPVAAEVAGAYIQLERVLWRSRVVGPEGETATGDDLLAIVRTMGLDRLPGGKASGFARFSGTNGTAIPLHTVVTTLGPNQLRFQTTASAVIAGGVADVPIEALAEGSAYNIPATAIQLLENPIASVSVTNLSTMTVAGVDEETDAELTARYLDFMADPPNGSNAAQYRKWARDVTGVGVAVALRPGEPNGPTPGNVDLYITDTAKMPASQVLIDAVQDYIAPPRKATLQAEDAGWSVFNANGVSIVDRSDDVGTTRRMVDHASGPGEIRYANFQNLLVQAGEWDVRLRALVNSTALSTNLVTVEVYSTSNAQIARATAASAFGTATYTSRAVDWLTTFTSGLARNFYWDGIETLELRIRRLAADTATQFDLDSVAARSHFSSNSLEGLAPILDQVNVKAPPTVTIGVVAAIKVLPGFAFTGGGGVQAAVMAAITKYLADLAFVPDDQGGNDVIYGEIGAVVQSTPGVDFYDPATFRVNGGTANVAIAKRELAVPGVYTVTEIP